MKKCSKSTRVVYKAVTIETAKHDWDSFIESAPQATVYHQYDWKALISKSFGHRCYYLAAIDEEGKWQGVLPLVQLRSKLFGNFIVSVPFVNYGGLLYRNAAAVAPLLDEAERLRSVTGATHVELRHIDKLLDDKSTNQHKVTMLLNLAESVDEQWRAFNAKVRNQVRKAEKSGLRCVTGQLELLDGFYQVFARNMRDLGTPVYSKKFFRNVLEIFSDSTKIFAVYHEDNVIAAGIGLWFKKTLEIPWASSIRAYKAYCPNNMLYWQAIQFAIEHGFKTFDFGRSTPNEGTYNFKKQWGAQPHQLHWQYLMDENASMPTLNPSNPKYQMAIRVWQHLPLALTKTLGPYVVRNIP